MDLAELVYSVNYDIQTAPLSQAEGLADNLADNIEDADGQVDNLNRSSGKMGGIFKKVAKIAAGLFAVDKVKDFGVSIVTVGADFEQSMANVHATMGQITDIDFMLLESAAKKAGKETKYTAVQSADALNYLALAGFKVNESVESLPYVLNLAAAGNMDLATTSDLVTDSMSVLGLQVDELGKYSDYLARTSQKSNTNIQQLAMATITVGGVAKDANMDLVSLNTELGILADSGKKGAEGGTLLRNVLLNLTAPNKKTTSLLKKLNVEVADSEGKFLKLDDILVDLKKSMAGYTQEQQQAIKRTIGGKENIAALNILLDGAGEGYKDLSKEVANSADAAKEMADIQNDTLTGSFKRLGSAIEGVKIETFQSSEVNDALKGSIDEIISRLPELQELAIEGFKFLADSIVFVTDNADGLVVAVELALSTLASFKVGAFVSSFVGGTSAMAAGIGGITVATEAATGAQAGLTTALIANPVGIVVASVAALGIALYDIYHNWDLIEQKAGEGVAKRQKTMTTTQREDWDAFSAGYGIAPMPETKDMNFKPVREVNIDKILGQQVLEPQAVGPTIKEQLKRTVNNNKVEYKVEINAPIYGVDDLENTMNASFEKHYTGLKETLLGE